MWEGKHRFLVAVGKFLPLLREATKFTLELGEYGGADVMLSCKVTQETGSTRTTSITCNFGESVTHLNNDSADYIVRELELAQTMLAQKAKEAEPT